MAAGTAAAEASTAAAPVAAEGEACASEPPGPVAADAADAADAAAPVRATLAPWAMALQEEMVQEMLCRTLKSLVRSRQRSWMKGTRSTSEHGIRQVLARGRLVLPTISALSRAVCPPPLTLL